MKPKRLNENEMFDLFDEQNFHKVSEYVAKYGINSVDRDGRTLLINFIVEHKTEFSLELIKNYKDLDIDLQDVNGWSALHFAAQENDVNCLKALIDKKATIDITDKHGNTPLWRALFENASEEIVLLLLESKADIKKKNLHGVPPKDLVEKSQKKVNAWLKTH